VIDCSDCGGLDRPGSLSVAVIDGELEAQRSKPWAPYWWGEPRMGANGWFPVSWTSVQVCKGPLHDEWVCCCRRTLVGTSGRLVDNGRHKCTAGPQGTTQGRCGRCSRWVFGWVRCADAQQRSAAVMPVTVRVLTRRQGDEVRAGRTTDRSRRIKTMASSPVSYSLLLS
jgi:hypothetical protein